MACPALRTDLSLSDAYDILEPYFVALQKVWVKAGYAEAARVKLYVAPSMHDSARHFGATRDDGLAMLIAPELCELPEPTVGAILAHEFGHATDFLYPGEFVLGAGRVAVRRDRSTFTDGQWIRWMKNWEQVHKSEADEDKDLVEYTADAIGELVTGRKIGYTGPCTLQTFDRGKARPQGLR